MINSMISSALSKRNLKKKKIQGKTNLNKNLLDTPMHQKKFFIHKLNLTSTKYNSSTSSVMMMSQRKRRKQKLKKSNKRKLNHNPT